MIRLPRTKSKESMRGNANKSIAKGRIKIVEPHKPILANNRIEEPYKYIDNNNREMDQIITMMQHHKVSDDNHVPSSEFKFSFPTTGSSKHKSMIYSKKDDTKHDTIRQRVILPLPKRKSRNSPETESERNTKNNRSLFTMPTSPFTFLSEKPMPKIPYFTSENQNLQQQQQQIHNSSSSVSLETANAAINNKKDRPSMSKKMKSMERVQACLTESEAIKIQPQPEFIMNYTSQNKATFDFPNFNLQFNNEAKKTFSVDAVDNNESDTTFDTFVPNHGAFTDKKEVENRKILNVKPPLSVIKRPIPPPNPIASNMSHKSKAAKDGEKKKSSKTMKKKTKSKKGEDVAPGGFLSSDITLFDNPLSDDWVCFFCQFDIFCNGLEDAKKKNGYYRRKKERLSRMRRAISELESSDELFFNQEEQHHCHHT